MRFLPLLLPSYKSSSATSAISPSVVTRALSNIAAPKVMPIFLPSGELRVFTFLSALFSIACAEISSFTKAKSKNSYEDYKAGAKYASYKLDNYVD